MNIGERIRIVRETSGKTKLSMASFADRLGVSSGAVSQWENGQRVPSNAVIHSIAKEFFINEEWLRTGNGEMLSPITREAEIAEITARLIKEDNPKRLALQKLFTDMSEENIELLYQTAMRWIEEVEKSKEPPIIGG